MLSSPSSFRDGMWYFKAAELPQRLRMGVTANGHNWVRAS